MACVRPSGDVLRLFGIDHERLAGFKGRRFRLTDVPAMVVTPLLQA
jgi:hypothetical protein